MEKPNFWEMSAKELRAYVMTHRDDNEAFYAYVDRLHAEANWVEYLPLKSIEDLKNYPEVLEMFRQDTGRQV